MAMDEPIAPARTSALRRGTGGPAAPSGITTFRVPPVDRVGTETRVAALATRSLKRETKQLGIRIAVSMLDLTTLEGKDTPQRVRELCRRAAFPEPRFPELPPCGAVCVYPSLVGVAKKALEGTPVAVASVATGFPAGRIPLSMKLAETRRAVAEGADEIDMVIDRAAFLAGDHAKVWDEIAATKDACGEAHLKVILETGELETYDNVRLASEIAMRAGGDFIKTSTGKVTPAATPAVVLVMLEAIRDYYLATGKKIGMKPAGGIRTSKQALQMLVLVRETLGDGWLRNDLFRIGASTLLTDLLRQYAKEKSGRYAATGDFPGD